MSTRRRPTRSTEQSPARSKTSILSIAFAIAMAFFLVIGMVAVALPQFIGGGDPETMQEQESPPSIQEQGEGEEQALRDRLAENPDDVDAMSQLAVMLSNSGRIEESIPYYEDALENKPEDTSLRLSFARALNRQGYTLDAEIQLEKVLDAEPDNVEATYLLAEVKEQEGEDGSQEATDLYERVVDLDPDSYYAEMARDRLGSADTNATEDPSNEGSADESEQNRE